MKKILITALSLLSFILFTTHINASNTRSYQVTYSESNTAGLSFDNINKNETITVKQTVWPEKYESIQPTQKEMFNGTPKVYLLTVDSKNNLKSLKLDKLATKKLNVKLQKKHIFLTGIIIITLLNVISFVIIRIIQSVKKDQNILNNLQMFNTYTALCGIGAFMIIALLNV